MHFLQYILAHVNKFAYVTQFFFDFQIFVAFMSFLRCEVVNACYVCNVKQQNHSLELTTILLTLSDIDSDTNRLIAETILHFSIIGNCSNLHIDFFSVKHQ